MSSTLIISALILALSSFTVQAKMFKCIDDNGKVSYSESRCKDTNAKEEAIIFIASSAQTAKEADEVGLMPGVPMGPHHPDTKRNPTGIIGYGINPLFCQLEIQNTMFNYMFHDHTIGLNLIAALIYSDQTILSFFYLPRLTDHSR